MESNHFPELQTERLLLRRLMPTDWRAISFLRSDKTVNEFVDRPRAESKEEALAFISKIGSAIDNQISYYWAITEKDQDIMIGSICLWNLSTDGKVAEVGYDLSPAFQGKGIMNESLNCLLSFGFDKLHLQVIEAYTHRLNEQSKKLLVKSGFVLAVDKYDEDYVDNIVFEKKHPVALDS